MSEREANGRFAKGNAGGPGNPGFRRLYSQMLHEVLTPDRFKLLIATALKEAVERKNMRALKFLVDRVLGTPRSEALPGGGLDMPSGLDSAAEVAKAANALLQGVASGQLSPEDAARTGSLIELARRALETQELERRVTELEARSKGDGQR